MGDKKAEPLLYKLLSSPAPDVRALAAIGLGLSRDRKHAAALAALARSPEAGPSARAAALYALGELGGGGAGAEMPLLMAAADSNEVQLRQAALLTMARLAGKDEAARQNGPAEAIAAGVFSTDEGLRESSARAAVVLSTKAYSRSREPLLVPDGPLSLRDVLTNLAPDTAGPVERAQALVALAPALERAAVAAVSTSPDRARVVADALLSGEAQSLGLAPFTDPAVKLDEKLAKQVRAAVEAVAAASVPGFVSLVRHPALEVRTRAVELLATRSEPEAQAAVIDALGDPEESVRRAALSAVGPVKHGPTITAVARLLREASSWPLRVRAAEALGRLGAQGSPGRSAAPQVVETLSSAARKDAYALVREASVRALVPLDAVAAAPLLREVAAKDAEPRVRETASELLRGLSPEARGPAASP
jgi:HEAT repeat protein